METWFDMVRRYFPDATDKQCDYILWERTAFPMADIEYVEEQLKGFRQEVKKSNRVSRVLTESPRLTDK